ncbi:hypothetical protein [Sandaracinus amylolyticus]|uniref:Uncharacterized protein n=1 Tax=Sandaracinus amylolyticus TaxID=927083 RepID=A0A0F6SGJ1_9BACT|nr:hypothetical protein [Sandaracinus amylolyticus]AKF08784.1 hypothetical protein DB32_005933 [Sandaracinus amylolyticus]
MSEHLQRDLVAGLVMLDARDPERLAAERHARECPSCATLLDDARALATSLDALAPPPGPSPLALSRAKAAILAQLERAHLSWPRALTLPAAAMATFVLLAVLMPRVRDVAWTLALGVIVVVAGRGAAALVRNTTRDAAFALALGVGTSVVLGLADVDGSGEHHGPACAVLELIAAVVPLAAIALVAWRARVAITPLGMATVAASGALAGQLVLRAVCPGRQLDHLLGVHVGGVIAAALIGAAIARVPALVTRAR